MASSVDWQSIELKEDEMADIKATFAEFDKDGNGHVTAEELSELFKAIGEPVPGYRLRQMIDEVDSDKSGTIEFDEFVNMVKKGRANSSKGTATLYRVSGKVRANLKKMGGTSSASAAATTHTYSDEETVAFADWINHALGDDADLKDILPIPSDNPDKLFQAVYNGLLVAKLINSAVPDTIDERALNKGKLNPYNIGENQTLVVNSAAAIGVNVTNVGAEDMIQGIPHIVLGVLWQIIRIGLFAKMNLQTVPGMAALLRDGEDISVLLQMSPEDLLLRWVNYHLEKAGTELRIHNFGNDIKDSEAYTYLLSQIAPRDFGIDTTALTISDPTQRAEKVLSDAEKMDCRKFVTATDIVKGNSKLNMAFVANLFNTYPALETEGEDFADFDMDALANETREERTFRNWMNSLGVKPFVNHFYSDLATGIIILQLIDKIKPGIVDWEKRVTMPPFKKYQGHMKSIENCNYAVELGKALKMSLVGIGGSDIYDGNKTLILGFVWQLMRAYTTKVLQDLSGSSDPITDAEIVEFANTRLTEAKKQTIAGFKDPYISTSLPIFHILDTIRPGTVNYELVHDPPATDEDKLANAKLAISLARKLGAGVYALPEDLVEVKPKMVMTIFACIQARIMSGKP
eukprot:TRINITY_DN12249_c0_g5_i3.p1 TRINITY_DN12249_c0_g5~~TRINITY_DN12249_c0_g5_i3.p1  ORF type:complete len:632 (+),score=222.38 TRINITY_DN12249_c0_g5_i3:93-1988(+)